MYLPTYVCMCVLPLAESEDNTSTPIHTHAITIPHLAHKCTYVRTSHRHQQQVYIRTYIRMYTLVWHCYTDGHRDLQGLHIMLTDCN